MSSPSPTTRSAHTKKRFTFEQRVQLVDQLTHKLKAFDCRFTRLLGNLNADFGLTRARLRILDWVIRYPDCNISRIAYDLDLSRQTVHRTVRAMERAGLLDLEEGNDRRSIYPTLTSVGRVVAKLRVTQAHAWSHRLVAPVDTAAVSAADWLLEMMLYHLPERLDPYSIDPENLPGGMPPSFEEALRRQQQRHPFQVPERPVHPIMQNGGSKLWPGREVKRGPLAKRTTRPDRADRADPERGNGASG